MSGGYEPIRSYQRIFRPERRIYSIEGRPLPVPGGVPLRWLAYATATLLTILAIGSGSLGVALVIAAVAGVAGSAVGGRFGGAVAAAGAIAVTEIAGLALGLIDWPLRVVVIPAAVATLATQATPDGRRADRFALSWIATQISPLRRSLGRALPAVGRAHLFDGEVWVSPDERFPRLRRGRVRGPALVFFSQPVAIRGPRRRRQVVQPAAGSQSGETAARRLTVGDGDVLKVRP